MVKHLGGGNTDFGKDQKIKPLSKTYRLQLFTPAFRQGAVTMDKYRNICTKLQTGVSQLLTC